MMNAFDKRNVEVGLWHLLKECGKSHAKWQGENEKGEKKPPLYMRKATAISLMHCELGEMTQAVRTGKKDKHLPHLPAEAVEAADVIIYLLGYADFYELPLIQAIQEKLEYNETREDHKPENRAKDGGKDF